MSGVARGLALGTYTAAGARAFEAGKTWEEALALWRKRRKHRLWIKGALRAFAGAGGFVPMGMLK